MSILNNQTERDLAKHFAGNLPSGPSRQTSSAGNLSTEGYYYDCYHGIKPVHNTDECRSCPFRNKCSWYSELEMRK